MFVRRQLSAAPPSPLPPDWQVFQEIPEALPHWDKVVTNPNDGRHYFYNSSQNRFGPEAEPTVATWRAIVIGWFQKYLGRTPIPNPDWSREEIYPYMLEIVRGRDLAAVENEIANRAPRPVMSPIVPVAPPQARIDASGPSPPSPFAIFTAYPWLAYALAGIVGVVFFMGRRK